MIGISLGIFGIIISIFAVNLELHSIQISIDKLVDIYEKEKENKE